MLKSQGFSVSGLGYLNGLQIKNEGAGIFARKPKRRHIRVTGRKTPTQSVRERIQIKSAIERAEGRSADMRTPTAFADRMAFRAHCLCYGSATLLHPTRLDFLRETD